MAKSADAFRTISEVAEWLGVQTHVLRFWESKFTQIKPVKRAGGRRYYRPTDMLLLGGIRKLLHDDGLTIKGVQKLLREEGMAHVADMSGPLDDETAAQVEIDVAPDAILVEAELAPAAPDETVTPFAPVSTPDVQTACEPEPEPLANAATDTPHPPDAPVSPATFVQEPVASHIAAEEPAAATPDIDPSPEAEPSDVPANPVFSRTSIQDTMPPVRDTDDSEPAVLPSFLSSRDEPAPIQENFAATEAENPEPAAAKPRVVDVPDVDDLAIEVAPSALGLAGRVKRLSPAQRSALRPLLAQLTALRDQMASAHRDPL